MSTMTLMDKITELDLDDVVSGRRDPDSEERLLLAAVAEYYLLHIDSTNMAEVIEEINANSDLEIEDEDFDLEDFNEEEDSGPTASDSDESLEELEDDEDES